MNKEYAVFNDETEHFTTTVDNSILTNLENKFTADWNAIRDQIGETNSDLSQPLNNLSSYNSAGLENNILYIRPNSLPSASAFDNSSLQNNKPIPTQTETPTIDTSSTTQQEQSYINQLEDKLKGYSQSMGQTVSSDLSQISNYLKNKENYLEDKLNGLTSTSDTSSTTQQPSLEDKLKGYSQSMGQTVSSDLSQLSNYLKSKESSLEDKLKGVANTIQCRSKWHWGKLGILCLMKLFISLVALGLSWNCNQNVNILLRIIISIISAIFSEIYILYYAFYRLMLGNKCF